MVYRLLLSLTLFVSGFHGFIDAVKADEPVFDEDNPQECEFISATLTNGTLEANLDRNVLSSYLGTPAKVEVYCSSAASISVDIPELKSGNTIFSENELTASVMNQNLNINVSSDGSGNKNFPEDTQAELIIHMEAKKASGAISSGKYVFTVTVTVTPN